MSEPTAMILDEGSPERIVEAVAVDGGWIVGFRVGNAMDGFDRINALIDAAQPHLTAPAPEPDGEALRARIAELEAALKPFASAELDWRADGDDERKLAVVEADGPFDRDFTVADLRRAADVMAREPVVPHEPPSRDRQAR